MMKYFISLFFLLSTTSLYAARGVNPDMGRRVLVSVGDFDKNYSQKWKKEICQKVFNIGNDISHSAVDVTCREMNLENFQDRALENLKPDYDYHLRILKNKDQSIGIDITNWKIKHESDFKEIGWILRDGEKSKVSIEAAFTRAIGNFFFFVSNQTAFKAGLLVNGVQESAKIKYNEKDGLFIDVATGLPLSINQAYSLFEKESPRKRNYLRTGIEIGVVMSAAVAAYYQNLAFNEVDFDYGFKDGLKAKFTGKGIKFDDNDKMSNYGHTFAGVGYFQIARSGGFNSLEAFLIALASSTTWELLEYREVLSINDQILTPIGGYVIGEATYQVSCALLQKNSFFAKAMAYTINPALATNHAIDYLKSKNKYAGQPDCKRARWSEISAKIGLDHGQKPYLADEKNNVILGLDATVVNLPSYGKEGRESKLVFDTAMAKLLVEANGNQGLIDLKVIAQVMNSAYHQKNIERDDRGDLRGYDILVGVGSASTWNDRGTSADGKHEDFYGTVNILGATAHADIYYKGFNIRADIGFYGDFAMVKSYALDKYKASKGGSLTGESAPIQRHDYYWGYGTSTLAAISVHKGRFEVGYKGQFSSANSLSGRDRFLENVESNYSDSYKINKVYISYQITKNLKIELAQEFNLRKGKINGAYDESGNENRTMGTLNYQFN
jgi:hypothetical protein